MYGILTVSRTKYIYQINSSSRKPSIALINMYEILIVSVYVGWSVQ